MTKAQSDDTDENKQMPKSDTLTAFHKSLVGWNPEEPGRINEVPDEPEEP